jgi:hypothetical protein
MKAKNEIRCVDCDGWPIDGGSVFVQVFLIHKGKSIKGMICERCWLLRLSRRGDRLNSNSGPSYQIDLPELNIRKRIPPPKPNSPSPIHPKFPPKRPMVPGEPVYRRPFSGTRAGGSI